MQISWPFSCISAQLATIFSQTKSMSGWNLPENCTQSDVDRAMGDYVPERDFGDLADEAYDESLDEEPE